MFPAQSAFCISLNIQVIILREHQPLPVVRILNTAVFRSLHPYVPHLDYALIGSLP